jgi:Outer membrane protein beta-barrel domain
MKFIFRLVFLFFVNIFFSQETEPLETEIVIDSLYREDQFYTGFNLNLMYNKPQGYSITKISPSFFAGFLRDMPINKSRTFALAIGIGATYNKYSHNLVISKSETSQDYLIADVDFDKNKLEVVSIDIPLEIRWRTATPESHRFLRVYTGVKLSYLVFSKSKYQDSVQHYKIIGNNDLTKLNTTAYITFGYNTWNLYAGYEFSPIFKETAKLNQETIGLNPFKVGFYIL